MFLALGLALARPFVVGWGLALFAAEYALFLSLRGGAVDATSLSIAAALLIVAELAFASIDAGFAGTDRGLALRAVGSLAFAVVATALIGGVVLVASTITNGGLAVEGIGAAAAVIAVALVARAGAHSRESTST
jgi:hypothetical protein